MKIKSLLFGIPFLFFFTSARAEFTDERLDAWLSTQDSSSDITALTREVILFFKPLDFKNRTGLFRALAIQEDQEETLQYLQNESQKILNLIQPIAPFLAQQQPTWLWASNAIALTVDKPALRKIKNHPSVDSIVENRVIELDVPQLDKPIETDKDTMTYGLKLIQAPRAWEQNIKGQGVVVGVLDTGVEENHPDLTGKILRTKNFTEENNTTDHHGHGTHVSGTIVGGNASGKAIGIAPEAKIIMGKIFSKSARTTLKVLLQGMEWMLNPDEDPSTDDAPRVVSNSWGSTYQFTYGFRNMIRTWRRYGIFPNFAAGNSGPIYFTIGAPGSYPFSFAVGAIDHQLKVARFSSRGPAIWWKSWYPIFITKPDIMAPGFSVYSSVLNGQWKSYSGTSMATPHVAGVIALALQMNPTLSVEDLSQILSETTLTQGQKIKNNKYGAGIIQVDKVLEKVKTWKSGPALYFLDKDPSQWEWDTP